jgi:hypothetical protein
LKKNFYLIDTNVVIRFIFVNQRVDIVDAFLLSHAKQCLGILSFDKDINR